MSVKSESIKATIERRNKRLAAKKKGDPKDKALSLVRRYHPEVEQVVDALKNIDIEVLDSDARGSTPLSPSHCALAEACARKVDGAIIGLGVAYLIKNKVAVRYRVPSAIQREIVSFDRNKDFRSGKFTLNAPKGGQKLGSDHRDKPTGPHKASAKRVMHITKGVRKL